MAGRSPNPATRSDSAKFAQEAVTIKHPEPPPHLDEEQAAHFRRLVKHFHPKDAQDETIQFQLALASQMLPEIEKLTADIAARGGIIQGPKGPQGNPSMNARRNLVGQVNIALKMVGFDSAKRFSTMTERGVLSQERQASTGTEHPDHDHDVNLFALPVVASAPRTRGAQQPTEESYDSLYSRN